MSTNKYSVTVIPDSSNVEHFTISSCNCRKCRLMHLTQMEWDTFTPRTRLQERMKKVVERIENRELQNSASS